MPGAKGNRRKRRKQRSCGLCKPYKRAGNSEGHGDFHFSRYKIRDLVVRRAAKEEIEELS